MFMTGTLVKLFVARVVFANMKDQQSINIINGLSSVWKELT